MPFLRPGHDGTFASPLAPSAPKSRRASQYLTLFSLSAASLASSASAKPFRAVGVKAWTSGSQTFIRARPSADVPPVAKVGRHTPLYVWGKYNGWYRVETHDHIFGWVYNQYIETPKAGKVRAMPQSKARLASDRTAHQKVYGSPQLLKKYFATYGAPKREKAQIRLASDLKSAKISTRTAPKSRIVLAKATPRILVEKPNLTAMAKPRIAASSATRPRLASVPRLPGAPVRVSPVTTPRVTSPIPRVERVESVRVARALKPRIKPATKPMVRMASAKIETPNRVAPNRVAPNRVAPNRVAPNRVAPNRVIAPALSGKMSGYAAPRVESFEKSKVVAPVVREVKSAPRAVESGKIARSWRALSPSARLFARAATDAASRRESVAAQSSASAQNGEPATDSQFRPVPVESTVASIAPVAPRAKVRATRVRRSVKASNKKALARTAAKKRYATRRERQRELLRARMGTVSVAPHSVIAPVSPAELMKARQDYLSSRKARLGIPASPADTQAPVTQIAPLPDSDASSSTELAPLAPAQFAPMAYESSHPLAPLMGNTYVVALAQLKSKPIIVAPKSAALVGVAAVAPLPVRGGSPRNRALSRGGSPRDRMGAGMASQALSYRGMPYIRGAASPRRGFDCSGLVYFLLKQRGYNPPRTAAGYARWGQSVPRNQLKSGDLVLFANTYRRGISHIGVYMGEGKFVHAATSSTGVRVSSLNEKYYAGKYYGARRAK